MGRKTTSKEYEAFKDEFEFWQDALGLNEYGVNFVVDDLDGAYAVISRDAQGCSATVRFCKFVPDNWKMDENEARLSGKHECLHLFLGRLWDLAHTRHTTEAEIDHEEERIVRVLEKIL